MGVKGLWPILKDVGQERPLSNLKGKTVAIDSGIWIVQSHKKKTRGKKQHFLQNLFYRLRYLLTNGIMPVVAIDGTPPDLKANAIRERNKHLDDNCIVDRGNFNIALKECQDLLDALGVPWLKSAGEAESLCGFLNSNGVVDACITEDNDVFLYGATTVLRGFEINSKIPKITEFSSERINKELHLNREKLVALALLLGCGYDDKGVPGIGDVNALEFLNDCSYVNVLERFKQWKCLSPKELFPLCEELYLDHKCPPPHCKRCGHPGNWSKHKKAGCSECGSEITCNLPGKPFKCNCYWHKIQSELKVYNFAKGVDGFPNEKIIAEYYNQNEELSDKKLDWQKPNMPVFQEKAYNWFEWTGEPSMKKTLPIMTSWQIRWLYDQKPQIEFDLHPTRIVGQQRRKGTLVYKVLWQYKEEKNLGSGDDTVDEGKCTLEQIDLFSKAYPSTTEAYSSLPQEKKMSLEKKKYRPYNRRFHSKGRRAWSKAEKEAYNKRKHSKGKLGYIKRKIQVETPSVQQAGSILRPISPEPSPSKRQTSPGDINSRSHP